MIKLLRLLQTDPPLKSNQLHGLIKVSTVGPSFVFQTLERRANENRKETSCLKKGTYKYDMINPDSHYPIIRLHGTGRRDNRIQVFRESPVWIGTEKVFNTDAKRYEFGDFRETFRLLCSLIPREGLFFIGEYDTTTWPVEVPEIIKSTFLEFDDEPIVPVPPSESEETDFWPD